MHIFELIITSFSLAMDAFAVSICKGITNKKNKIKNSFIIGLSFGIFQAIMPFLGYHIGNILSQKIIAFDHYLALILLSIIGISMIRENDNETYNDKITIKELTLLSLATSIDALIVGVTLSFLKVNIITSIATIGIITFITCFIGYNFGSLIGKKINKNAKIIGGITLIIIGIKIFIEHIT